MRAKQTMVLLAVERDDSYHRGPHQELSVDGCAYTTSVSQPSKDCFEAGIGKLWQAVFGRPLQFAVQFPAKVGIGEVSTRC